MNRPVALLMAVVLGAGCARASDSNSLGFYAGAAAGQARDPFTTPSGVSENDTGWKAMVGMRPVRFVGAELEYVDFGQQRFSSQPQVLFSFAGSAHVTAEGLFAVGYLPLRVSTLELFAKAGAERVHTGASGSLLCNCDIVPLPRYRADDTQTEFAYGAGLQGSFKALHLRLEYERTSTPYGHPGLLSGGITYTF